MRLGHTQTLLLLDITLKVGASNALILGGTGADAVEVGIGMTTPTEKLELTGGGIRINNNYGIGFNDIPTNTVVTANDAGRIYYDQNLFGVAQDGLVIEKTDGNDATAPDGGIAFANKATDNVRRLSMIIRGNGNVGIGTTTPSAKLHILGTPSTTNGTSFISSVDYLTDLVVGTSYNGAYVVLKNTPFGVLPSNTFFAANQGVLNNTTGNTDYTRGMLGFKGNNGGNSHNIGVWGEIVGQTGAAENIVSGGLFFNNNSHVSYPNQWGIYVAGASFQTTGVWTASDRAFKKQITPLSNALTDVSKLNLYSYYFNEQHPQAKQLDLVACPEKQFGVLAQELETVFPDMVTEDGYGNKLVKYEALIPVALKAIQELEQKNKTQENRIEILEKQNTDFMKRLEALEKK